MEVTIGIIGIIIAILALIIPVFWDIHKREQETKERESSVLHILMREMGSNAIILENNIYDLETELKELTKENVKSYHITKLIKVRNTTWDLVKYNTPRQLINDRNLLANIYNSLVFIDELNNDIGLREQHRVNNTNNNDFFDNLYRLNRQLLTDHQLLVKETKKLCIALMNAEDAMQKTRPQHKALATQPDKPPVKSEKVSPAEQLHEVNE